MSTVAMLLAVAAAVAILIWAPGLVGLGAAIAAAVAWCLVLDGTSDEMAHATGDGRRSPPG